MNNHALRILGVVFCPCSQSQLGETRSEGSKICFHPPSKKNYVSMNVAFIEEESYFRNPYLEGEHPIKEDREEPGSILKGEPRT